MYKERYPLQAAEAQAQSLWVGRVWGVPCAHSIQDAVMSDIFARLVGQKTIAGETSLSKLGVLVPAQLLVPTNLFQGADAFRLGCILSEKTQSCPPSSCLRLVHQIAHKLQGAEAFSEDVITMYIHQNPQEAAIINSLKNKDIYGALSLVRSGLLHSLSAPQKSFYLAVLYPMVPHVTCYILPDAQKQAAAFYSWVQTQPRPVPVLVNNRRCALFWPPENASQEDIEKEVLSLPAVLNKIKGKSIQRIIYKKGKVVHVVV